MKRHYSNSFRSIGFTRLSHCCGDDWTEVWSDEVWETKPLTANRAKFLWTAIQKECPWLEVFITPRFVPGRKYILMITDDETTGSHVLSLTRPA